MGGKQIGVMGSGKHMRRSHLAHAAAAGFKVKAVCDPSAESIAKTRAVLGYDFDVCGSARELLKLDIDAVLIGSRDQDHAAQLLQAVIAGKDVLCEKPLAISSADMVMVYEAFELAHAKGLIIASCHPRRDTHNPDLPYGWIKANLASLLREFGRLQYIGLESSYERVTDHTRTTHQGFLLDKFPHDIDYLRFLLDAQPFVARRRIDSRDHYEVVGQICPRLPVAGQGTMPKPIDFSCRGTRLHGQKKDDQSEYIETICLEFEHGVCVVYTSTGLVRYHDRRTDEPREDQITPLKGDEAYSRIFRPAMQDFASAIRDKKQLHRPEDLLLNTRSTTRLASKGEYKHMM